MNFSMNNAFQMPPSYYGGGRYGSSFGGVSQNQFYGPGSSSLQAASSSQYYSQLMFAQESLYSGWGQFGGNGVGQSSSVLARDPMYGGFGGNANFNPQAPATYNFGSAFNAYQSSQFGNNFQNPFGVNPLTSMNLSEGLYNSTFPSYGNGMYPNPGSGFDLGGMSSGLNISSLLTTAFSLFL